MNQLQNQKATTPRSADLDDAELLGFEHIDFAPVASTSAEDAVALALNKRGENGEGPPIISDRRLKTHVKRVGDAARGVNLYSFRYIGEDREFLGVIAQELLADERHRLAVEATSDGYYRVHYPRLGLANLGTNDMLAAGERAARRAGALAS
jgi:Chaperone of endosialidase